MRLVLPVLPVLPALFVAASACGSVVALEGADPRAVDAGAAPSDAATDAAGEPPFDESQCPRAAVALPATREESYAGAAYAGGGASVALGLSSTVQRFRFTPNGLAPDGDPAPAPLRGTTVRALPSSNAFTIAEGFSDAETRTVKVYGRGFTELTTLTERNARFEDIDREGISSAGQIVYPFFGRGTAGVAIDGGSVVCMACTLAGVADTSLYVFNEGFLEQRSLAGAFPGVDVDRKIPVLYENGAEVPRLVGASAKLLFFTRGRERVTVYDRETLTEVPFAWEPSEVPTGVVARADGTLDLFSVQYGEIAFASHRDGTGNVLARGEGHAAYGFANPTPCGFWVGNQHIPFAR